MSLQPQVVYLVPEETARVARAAFPKGDNPYILIRDHLGMIYADQDFAALFPKDGQPAESPFRLALTTVMQFGEGLTDRQAADAVRSRSAWKYALGLHLEDPGFDASVLCEFRPRRIAGHAERLLFDTLLMLLRDQGFVKARGRQRTDSTHVVAAMPMLNRLELLGETLRHALNRLAVVAPAWLQGWVPPAWFDRYGKQISDDRLPHGPADRVRLAEQFGTDGRQVLRMGDAPAAPPWLREMPAVEPLRKVWQQPLQAVPGEEPMKLQGAAALPPSSELIGAPYAPAARYRITRATEWVGYVVQLTARCDDDLPPGLTAGETTPATTTDNLKTGEIHKRLAANNLTPREPIVDAGYVTAEQLVTSEKQGTELLGPVIEDQRWPARAGEGFAVAQFAVDWEAQQATCPQGQPSVIWKPPHDSSGHAVVAIRWAQAAWRDCPVRRQGVQTKRPRSLMIRTQAEHAAWQAARARQHTDECSEQYKNRAGSEGTINQGVALGALRRSRYSGLVKTSLLQLLIGTAMNLVRIAAWLAERPRARTRTSPFATVAPACAA